MTPLVDFVHSLREGGRVRVPDGPGLPGGLVAAVRELDRLVRPTLAGDPPPLSEAAGGWALEILYRACQFLIHRDIEADTVRQALGRPCPEPPGDAVCYSADLALQYLPDLLSLARGVAPDDPLATGLTDLARLWPLSSVGVKGLGEAGGLDTEPFIGHPSLRQLYVDRIIERQDVSRLDDPAVRQAVREALGHFPELAPAVIGAAVDGEFGPRIGTNEHE